MFVARGVDVRMPEAKLRATFLSEGNKTDVTRFLGYNLLVSFHFAAMASSKVTYLLIA